MASDSVSTLIIFIGAMIAATAVAGTLITTIGGLDQPVDAVSDKLADDMTTDITIISDAGSDSIYNSSTHNITILVKNTGSGDLTGHSNQVDVIVNGEYAPVNEFELIDSPDNTWDKGEVAEITIEKELAEDEHRVIVHANKAQDTLRFTTYP